MLTKPEIIRTCESEYCCDEVWEAAYLRFETPQEEIAKFKSRLRALGASQWPSDSRIVEIFCGRGHGLAALRELGFSQLEGCDLSETLLEQCQVPAQLFVADCRKLPFEDSSRDIIIVQGGLHHLPELSNDLPGVLSEVARVLKAQGLFVVVEPWMTPFLATVHFVSRQSLVRRLAPKLDALQIMIEREATTYFKWLNSRRQILAAFKQQFTTVKFKTGFGKLQFVGKPSISRRDAKCA